MTDRSSALKLAMTVHRELSQTISPATPDTIRASSVVRNPALKTIAGIAAAALLVLVGVTLLTEGKPSENGGTGPMAATRYIFLFCGGILGAAFYAFWTAREYLRDGTFDPKYSQVYLVRFGLGVMAGFILGSVVAESKQLSEAAKDFGPFTLAVVGGFSAEAVVQILQRISDILLATVRGSDKERAKANAERITAQKMNESAAMLQEALQHSDPKATKAAVQQVVRDMMKG